jgi:hypothetical protein
MLVVARWHPGLVLSLLQMLMPRWLKILKDLDLELDLQHRTAHSKRETVNTLCRPLQAQNALSKTWVKKGGTT